MANIVERDFFCHLLSPYRTFVHDLLRLLLPKKQKSALPKKKGCIGSDWCNWAQWCNWTEWRNWIQWRNWSKWCDWTEWRDWAKWRGWGQWCDWSDWRKGPIGATGASGVVDATSICTTFNQACPETCANVFVVPGTNINGTECENRYIDTHLAVLHESDSSCTPCKLSPVLPVNFIICTNGVFPTTGDGPTGLAAETPYVGQITMSASTIEPQGWVFCDGQLLQVASFPSLFSVLGSVYGGDGVTTFAVPDLRNRWPIHPGLRSQ